MGGKFKILDKLLSIFPPRIDRFIDLFCGGLNVSLNVESKSIIANDNLPQLIEMYQYFQNKKETVLSEVKETIAKYGISKTNKEGYYKLRNDYNNSPDSIRLFVLISNSFNHQLRFNKDKKFNMPFGYNRSQYNTRMEENLKNLLNSIANMTFTNLDFRDVEIAENDFVYCDPPYNLTTAVYNTDWTEESEKDLLSLLGGLKCQFALSTVLFHNSKENKLVSNWSKKYRVHYIDWKYGNSSYHKKNRSKGVEACVTNY